MPPTPTSGVSVTPVLHVCRKTPRLSVVGYCTAFHSPTSVTGRGGRVGQTHGDARGGVAGAGRRDPAGSVERAPTASSEERTGLRTDPGVTEPLFRPEDPEVGPGNLGD